MTFKMIALIVLLWYFHVCHGTNWPHTAMDRSLLGKIGDTLELFENDVLSMFNGNHLRSILKLRRGDPEMFMTVNEIIQYHGYPVENYDVQTDDGYILTIQRIPYGKKGHGSKPRKPVLIQHGLMCNSGVWLANTRDKILPDEGYDVWLGNFRGSVFGKRHVRLSPHNWQFWKFSYEQIAENDLPKIIDTMLNVTGFSNIFYIGHSMGTTVAFAMLANNTKYNHVIKGMFALAPIVTVTHMQGLIRHTVIFLKYFGWLLNTLHINPFAISPIMNNILSRVVCRSPLKIICRRVIFEISGESYAQFNMSRLPMFLHHTPDTTSLQNFQHISQTFYAGKLQRWDYGMKTNWKKYGQPQPPEFDMTKITTPLAIFWSDNDKLATPKDVARLTSQLKNVTLNYRVPFNKFAHLDFIWAVDVKSLVYDKVVDTMNKMWQ